ncbi:MAG: hypothetical protein RBQ71_02850 [Acholeplasmataceae bacterium]|jgi:predicted small lipoprotein YifL|nr:hypothetical protein [Acholeplasmataceae bacterium]
MRKLYTLLVALVLVFGLAACTDNGNVEFPTFDEDDVVQLSASEMITLFESIDYTAVDTESIRITTQGHIFVLNEDSEDSEYYSYTSRDDTKITIDATIYGLASDVIGEVRLHGEGEIDFQTSSYYDDDYSEPEESSQVVKGTMGVYFVDGYLYVKADVEHAEDGADLESANFKQKLNQQVTQAMLDETMGQADPDQIDDMIPQEYLDMLENGEFDEIMDAIPNLKVYKDGDTYSIVFSVTKQVILDSLEEMIQAVMEATGSEMTPTEISEMVTEAETQINTVVDELEFTYVISITGSKVTKVAEMLTFKSVDGKIDIDMTSIIEVGVDLPSFPDDLDEYTLVDEIGEGVFEDDSNMYKS